MKSANRTVDNMLGNITAAHRRVKHHNGGQRAIARLAAGAVALLVATSCAPAPSGPGGGQTSGSARAIYTVAAGAHAASIFGEPAPISAFTVVSQRSFLLSLNASAVYTLADTADQLDWNKLPGFSDCGTLDLSQNGAMFGWRWRPDLSPARLELAAYANTNGVHQWSPALATMSEADLNAPSELKYSVGIDSSNPAQYRFRIEGFVGSTSIDVSATLARACPGVGDDGLKWASGLYFGGTSVAPHAVTATMREL